MTEEELNALAGGVTADRVRGLVRAHAYRRRAKRKIAAMYHIVEALMADLPLEGQERYRVTARVREAVIAAVQLADGMAFVGGT